MPNLSPYADAESGAPSWRTGERESAIVFLSLTLYIILDVNVAIYRVFRKKQGLYYWSLIFATWGTATVAVGNIFKNLKPEWGVIWPLWTLMINGGWSVYAPAELLVLYSRLHLVNQNHRLHRWLLVMIVVGSTLIIIPNWVFVFGAYDIDPIVSSVWSPRMAIIDRVSQAGFTLFETVISIVYISSLLEILRTKITTRTRRVMRDLVFVNVLVISMDLLVIILIFLNQANLAYPLQDFTYAFKFKIEFAVLNQLMAVAASGSRHYSRPTTFEDRRYRATGQTTMLKGYSDDDLNGVRLPFLSTSTDSKGSPQPTLVNAGEPRVRIETMDHTKLVKPLAVKTREIPGTIIDPSFKDLGDSSEKLYDHDFTFQPGPDLELSSHSPSFSRMSSSTGDIQEKSSEIAPLAPVTNDIDELTLATAQTPEVRRQQQKKANRVSLRQLIFRKQEVAELDRGRSSQPAGEINHDEGVRNRIAPFRAPTDGPSISTQNRPAGLGEFQAPPQQGRFGGKRKAQREKDEEDDDQDGVHLWERRGGGRTVLEAPWFRMASEAIHKIGTESERQV